MRIVEIFSYHVVHFNYPFCLVEHTLRQATDHTNGNFFTSYPRPTGWRCDEGAVGGWRDLDGVLEQAGEAVADAVGGAAIEADDELVEVGR